MKTKIRALLYCLFTLLWNSGNNAQQKTEQNNVHEKSLIGIWDGTLKSSKNPLNKTWQIMRKSDGSFIKNEIWKIKGRTQKINRKGTWWTKNGNYYEQYDSDELLPTKQFRFPSPYRNPKRRPKSSIRQTIILFASIQQRPRPHYKKQKIRS